MYWRWKDLPVRYKGLVVVATPAIALVLTALLFYVGHVREARAREAVSASFQLKADVQVALTLMVDAETGVRGFLLAKDPVFLAPFHATESRLAPQFQRIREAPLDPQERRQLDVLERLCQERLAVLRGFVERPDDIVPARFIESKQRMDAVRQAAAVIADTEDERLAARQDRARTAEAVTLLLVWAGALAGILAGIIGALLFTNGVTANLERASINAERLATGEPLLPVHTGNDEIGRLKHRLHDVAAVLKARDEALQARVEQVAVANKELEAFSYSVSHDLRAPLRHVTGFASLLEKHSAGHLDDTGRRYIRVIVEAAARMGHLVDDLLAFSRMAKAELAPTDIDLNALVADVLAEMERETGGRDVRWNVLTLPHVRGDRAMLRVALVNLISNAVKYTGTRRHAEIEIGSRSAQPGESVVYVKDNGVGFDMKYADKLFGVFQRLHSSEQFEGTGIGLANVRRIVERHGGRAWAESVLDSGSTFYLALPA
jgi:signal transduction histidine kinase